MWQKLDDAWVHDSFPLHCLVSRRSAGNLRDPLLRADFCRRQGLDPSRLVTARQVHGTGVAVAVETDRGRELPGCDGLLTAVPGTSVALFTADCLPILVADPVRGVAGAIHAGWRGLAAGIVSETIKILYNTLLCRPQDIAVTIGPHICGGCFRVGPEVFAAFGLRPRGDTLDLAAIAQAEFLRYGITRVDVSPLCTAHQPEEFFSYRREKTADRLLSVVTL